MTRILLSAGDASGELHAAALVEALRRRLPDARFLGLGGSAMEKAGVELRVHQRELAVGGLVEVLGDLRRVAGAWRRMRAALREEPPDLVVLVDSPDFNLRLARHARRVAPVLYFVSPQVWAWRRWRVATIARRVDRLAAIFPFEPAVYAGTGLDARFVGHPLVDRLRGVREARSPARRREELGLDPEAPLVALLPGSRRNELRDSLPLQLASAAALHRRRPDVHFALGLAPSLEAEALRQPLAEAALPDSLRLAVLPDRTYDLACAANLALAKPGTVTVELTLLDLPMVVAARANPLTAWIARRVVRVPSLTMPNLIAGGPVVPEFLQEQARPERIADALEALLDGPEAELQRSRLARVREALGEGGAAERAADLAVELLDGTARP